MLAERRRADDLRRLLAGGLPGRRPAGADPCRRRLGRDRHPGSDRLRPRGGGAARWRRRRGAPGGLARSRAALRQDVRHGRGDDQGDARAALHVRRSRGVPRDVHRGRRLEFPQSGERFEGVETCGSGAATTPADTSFEFREVRGEGELSVAEVSVTYDGGVELRVSILELRGDRIARESIYVMEGFEPPDGAPMEGSALAPPGGYRSARCLTAVSAARSARSSAAASARRPPAPPRARPLHHRAGVLEPRPSCFVRLGRQALAAAPAAPPAPQRAPARRSRRPPASRSPRALQDQLLVGHRRARARRGPRRRAPAAAEPRSRVAAGCRRSRSAQLAGVLPAAVGHLLAGSVAEADRERPGGIHVGHVRVAGGGAVGVQGAFSVARRLARQGRRDLPVRDDPLEPLRRPPRSSPKGRARINGHPRHGHRLRGGSLSIGLARSRPPQPQAAGGPGRPSVAEHQHVGLGLGLALGAQHVAAVAGAEPAGQVELGEGEERSQGEALGGAATRRGERRSDRFFGGQRVLGRLRRHRRLVELADPVEQLVPLLGA